MTVYYLPRLKHIAKGIVAAIRTEFSVGARFCAVKIQVIVGLHYCISDLGS
jgi:hypothetical protein